MEFLDRERRFYLVLVLIIAGLGLLGYWKNQEEKRGASEKEFQNVSDSQSSEEERESDFSLQASGERDEKSEKETVIQVDIDGAVQKPGLYRLREGDRLQDAIQAAGGLTKQADRKEINLARRLADEEKVHVPMEGEKVSSSLSETGPASPGGAEIEKGKENMGERPSPSSKKGTGRGSGRININKADMGELTTLPSIGEARAKEIIAYRKEHPFVKIEEIQNITGIGKKTYQKLKDLISVK